MLKGIINHIRYVSRQILEYVAVVLVAVAIGIIFIYLNTPADRLNNALNMVKAFATLGVGGVCYMFLMVNTGMVGSTIKTYSITRRCTFFGNQILKIIMAAVGIGLIQLTNIIICFLQKAPIEILSFNMLQDNFGLFILLVTLGEFFGYLTIILGKWGVILYTIMFSIFGGVVGFMSVANVTIIQDIAAAMQNGFLSLIGYVGIAMVLSVIGYFIEIKTEVKAN